MRYRFHDDWRLPIEPGQALDRGWTAANGQRPVAVTWHWTATATLAECNALLGGDDAAFKGRASAHYAVGRTFDEGIARYVDLGDRSWHAGKHQTLRFDGRPYAGPDDKGARTSIGVETVNLGYARDGVPAAEDWIRAHTVDGQRAMLVQPWTDEQVEMMIAVGREILARWPHLGPRCHHGHHDLCPGYKVDPAGFPFARVLRGIYGDPDLPDVWTRHWTDRGRRSSLRALGYDSAVAVDADAWFRADDLALRRFQRDQGMVPNGLFTTAVCWRIHDAADG
ncbi:MAG: N-acetylmuramoyl-L-alanine amidase [Acidobacteriota bacterium]